MEMLDEVNINPLPPFDAGMGGDEDDADEGEEGGEGKEDKGDEGVVEVEADGNRKKRRANSYTEIDDITLCRAWAAVRMDAVSGTDQTGKRYWQRIEDKFHKLMPRVRHPIDRTYRSLQGRWDAIKPACSRWAASMDQVVSNPPNGATVDEYDRIADARYRDMASSKGKRFTMRHFFDVLQHLPKWQLRDEEVAPKKAAMVALDDTEDEKKGWNADKPEGNKKAKERLKLEEEEAALLRDKFDQMMKSKEVIAAKTLETKLVIIGRKKEVSLAKVEANREKARNKAKLEEMRINMKKTKAMKQLLAEEREITMMNTKHMNEQQLEWWKEASAEITARRILAREEAIGGGSVTHGGGGDDGHGGPTSVCCRR
nr:glutathione S-transferase T3-like [Lolium perenne]